MLRYLSDIFNKCRQHIKLVAAPKDQWFYFSSSKKIWIKLDGEMEKTLKKLSLKDLLKCASVLSLRNSHKQPIEQNPTLFSYTASLFLFLISHWAWKTWLLFRIMYTKRINKAVNSISVLIHWWLSAIWSKFLKKLWCYMMVNLIG